MRCHWLGITNFSRRSVRPEDATAKDYYFDSYAHHVIHQEMIKDKVFTNPQP